MKSQKLINYVSKPVCPKGYVKWEPWENEIWNKLVTRQNKIIEDKACKEFIEGKQLLDLNADKIPQIPDLNHTLKNLTGWTLEPVPSIISFDYFFNLLSQRKFPCITFIRVPQELDYASEPDIFHEIYGHCAMLTNPYFADFTHRYGKLGKKSNEEQRKFLARLYFFTVEFGLVKQEGELKIFGGGILSSIGETFHSLESSDVERRPMNILQCLRTPYGIYDMQNIYYYINGISDLYRFENDYIMRNVNKAMKLGLHKPRYEFKHYYTNNGNSQIQNQLLQKNKPIKK